MTGADKPVLEKLVSEKLVLGIPSKGRLMEDTLSAFQRAGLAVERIGDERGYRGQIPGLDGVTVEFLSASEIARHLQQNRIQLGVTGEDLVREQIPDASERVDLLLPLNFGHADVVVAAPQCWLDVETMVHLEEAAALFYQSMGRHLRVATKYPVLTRRFFTAKGVHSYQTVESLGATEGTIAAGMAETIVDITSTGTTLKANGLRVLDDGLILKSMAHLIASKSALVASAGFRDLATKIANRLAAAMPS
jgi:ATP phosphoribosyltransferase